MYCSGSLPSRNHSNGANGPSTSRTGRGWTPKAPPVTVNPSNSIHASHCCPAGPRRWNCAPGCAPEGADRGAVLIRGSIETRDAESGPSATSSYHRTEPPLPKSVVRSGEPARHIHRSTIPDRSPRIEAGRQLHSMRSPPTQTCRFQGSPAGPSQMPTVMGAWRGAMVPGKQSRASSSHSADTGCGLVGRVSKVLVDRADQLSPTCIDRRCAHVGSVDERGNGELMLGIEHRERAAEQA